MYVSNKLISPPSSSCVDMSGHESSLEDHDLPAGNKPILIDPIEEEDMLYASEGGDWSQADMQTPEADGCSNLLKTDCIVSIAHHIESLDDAGTCELNSANKIEFHSEKRHRSEKTDQLGCIDLATSGEDERLSQDEQSSSCKITPIVDEKCSLAENNSRTESSSSQVEMDISINSLRPIEKKARSEGASSSSRPSHSPTSSSSSPSTLSSRASGTSAPAAASPVLPTGQWQQKEKEIDLSSPVSFSLVQSVLGWTDLSKPPPNSHLMFPKDPSIFSEAFCRNITPASDRSGATRDFLKEARTSGTLPSWYLFGKDGKCLWCDGSGNLPGSSTDFTDDPLETCMTFCHIEEGFTLPNGKVAHWKPIILEKHPLPTKCACRDYRVLPQRNSGASGSRVANAHDGQTISPAFASATAIWVCPGCRGVGSNGTRVSVINHLNGSRKKSGPGECGKDPTNQPKNLLEGKPNATEQERQFLLSNYRYFGRNRLASVFIPNASS